MPSVFATLRLAAGCTVAVTVEMVAVGVSTVSKELTVPFTTLLNVPVKVDRKTAVIVYLTAPLIDKDTVLLILPVPDADEQAVVTTVVATPGATTPQTQVTDVNAVDRLSVTVELCTTEGPALFTKTEYVMVCVPWMIEVGDWVFETLKPLGKPLDKSPCLAKSVVVSVVATKVVGLME